MGRLGPDRDPQCPTCGRVIYYGLWEHITACAREKQQREDAKRAVENGKRFVEGLLRKVERHSTESDAKRG